MSTTIDDEVTPETSEAPQKPTKRQRQAAGIADAASGGLKMLLVKLLALGILDAIAVFAVFVLFGGGQWLIAAIVAVVAAVVNWIYFSRRKLPAKYLTPGIIFLVLFQVFVLVYTGTSPSRTTVPGTTAPRSKRSRRSWPRRCSAWSTRRPTR